MKVPLEQEPLGSLLMIWLNFLILILLVQMFQQVKLNIVNLFSEHYIYLIIMPPKVAMTCDYALTITLKGMGSLTTEQQYAVAVPIVKDKLIGVTHSTVVELTKNFDVHFHSIFKLPLSEIKGKSVEYVMKNKLRHLKLGFNTIKQVTDYDVWTKYLKKDLQTTGSMLPGPVTLHDDYNIFGIEKYLEKI